MTKELLAKGMGASPGTATGEKSAWRFRRSLVTVCTDSTPSWSLRGWRVQKYASRQATAKRSARPRNAQDANCARATRAAGAGGKADPNFSSYRSAGTAQTTY